VLWQGDDTLDTAPAPAHLTYIDGPDATDVDLVDYH
jgi:hypothetical protein